MMSKNHKKPQPSVKDIERIAKLMKNKKHFTEVTGSFNLENKTVIGVIEY